MDSVGATEAPAGAAEQAGRPAMERLNAGVQQQLNLESVKTRAIGLYKTIARILEDFDAYSRSNSSPKWEAVLGQFSMVSMELFNIVEDIKKVSKAFVVYPRNVNAEKAQILPVMLSSKLLPEMETEDNSKREQLLNGITNLPVPTQIEKLKARIDMIQIACEAAEKVIADCKKMYGLGSRQGPSLAPTLDKAQAAKIQEQENALRAACNFGEGLRAPQGDQRQMFTSLPSHLVEVLGFGDGPHNSADNSAGMYPKSNSPFTQGSSMQVPGMQLGGRSTPSPAGPTFDSVSTPPNPIPNIPINNNNNIITNNITNNNNTMNNSNVNMSSPRSGGNLMSNTGVVSPQQVQMLQQQFQQRQKNIQQVNQVNSQHMRAGSNQSVIGQGTVPQLHDLQGQAQQKIQQVQGQMQYTQPSLAQQYQNRHTLNNMQHPLLQNHMNQGNNHLRTNLGQFSATPNTNSIFNTAQASPNSQMLTNMSNTMQSQSVLPRMQYGLAGGHPQRNLPSQILNDQMFGMGAGNPGTMVGMGQQQGMFSNPQNLQQGMMGLQNPNQNPNFTQQRTQSNQ
ncbi:hypothetical protein LUZ60_002199 [Juncus effusus]|nr:hypothetical protein LUZ60_002199 [Juncus effusus]